jgi:hypothetical protein
MLPKLLTKLDGACSDFVVYTLRSGVPSNDPLPLLALALSPEEELVVGRKMELLVIPRAMKGGGKITDC